MKNSILAGCLVALISQGYSFQGQSTVMITPRNPGGQGYLARAMQAPLTFTVPRAQSDEVWRRITSFMIRYLNGGTQGKVTDSVVATGSVQIGISRQREAQGSEYSANRIVRGDLVEFSIQSDLLNAYKKTGEQKVYVWTDTDLKIVEQNLHIWALYASTGEIRPELVDKVH